MEQRSDKIEERLETIWQKMIDGPWKEGTSKNDCFLSLIKKLEQKSISFCTFWPNPYSKLLYKNSIQQEKRYKLIIYSQKMLSPSYPQNNDFIWTTRRITVN